MKKTNQQVFLVSSFLESSTDSKVDGSATLEGLFEPFVEAVIGRLRGGNGSGKEILAYYDLAVLERKRTIAVTERERRDLVFTSGQVAVRMLNRIAYSFAVDIQVTVYTPRLMFLSYNYNFHNF